MCYSIDLRKRVVEYVENGGRIAQAAVLFKVGRATIYRWLSRGDLEATKVKRRKRKLDWKALEQDVKEKPDARLIDLADRADMHRTYIGAIERCERNISLLNILRLADALELKVKELFDEDLDLEKN